MKNNWIVEFNKVEIKIYDMNYKLGEKIEEIYNQGYGIEFYKMCEEVLINTKYNNKRFNNIDEKFEYLTNKYNEVLAFSKDKNPFGLMKIMNKELIIFEDRKEEMILENVIKKCGNIDANRFKNRCKLLQNRIRKQFMSYLNLFMGAIDEAEREIIEELTQYRFDFSNKYQNKKLDELRQLENLTIDKFKYRKIFDYKDMCKHAKSNGFEYKRTTGDHMMFEHKKTKELIPIPAHELRYGLMREIQKEIKEKSAA